MARINFFSQDISFKISKPRKTKQWILDVLSREKKELVELNYIFCSDAHLLSINKEYLNHDTLTDIITFDNSEAALQIEGDIFISIERVVDNARELKVNFDDELHRVLIHGLLHLVGYGDKTSAEKLRMRKKEDACLSLRNN
jgi:probable rRNA maturation factor